MKIDQNILTLDIKVQDKFRNMLAKANGDLKLGCVQLGDSDIDYENSSNMNNARILNAPFNVERIKYPLIFDGSGRGLEGTITSFARKVNDNGTVSSVYNYPSDAIFTVGNTMPSLSKGMDFEELEFDGSRMGYIVFGQTLLQNYIEPQSRLLKRLNEKILFKVTFNGSTTIPIDWDVVIDTGTRRIVYNNKTYDLFNNSILIAKNSIGVTPGNFLGEIKMTGETTNITKTINFNI